MVSAVAFCPVKLHSSFILYSLVSLLEHAEDVMSCKMAFVFFRRSLPYDLQKHICRDFSFFGFEILSAATHPNRPIGCVDFTFMAYKIDPDDESGDEIDFC